MKPTRDSARNPLPPRWMMVVVAFFVVGATLFLVRLPREERLAPRLAAPVTVEHSGVWLTPRPVTEEDDDRFQEEMDLMDPSPLFLPTRWNSGGASRSRAREQNPVSSFQDFGPWYAFSENDPAINFHPGGEFPTKAMDAIPVVSQKDRHALLSLGRRDGNLRALTGRLGWFEIVSAEQGRPVYEGALNVPPGIDFPQRDSWAPVRLVLAVGPAGIVGRPMLLESSGDERIDNLLPRILALDDRIAGRLDAGVYRISVGQ